LRERVYCYELYHQMRCHWPDEEGYTLNGELDKAAHPVLSGLGLGKLKPDFLVHRPGDMRGNHAVIEVKCSNARMQGLNKDIETLTRFRRAAGYKRAILLVFGASAERRINQVNTVAANLRDLPTIELWVHKAPGEEAFRYCSIGND